jgi:arylsulfatase A-like enzyme
LAPHPPVRRRALALALAATLAVLALPGPVASTPAAPPPNIVVLMLDDFAFIDQRIWERLPNIKALFVDAGVEALNYWGNDPLCCPGRANFLTAQVAHVNGVIQNDARLLDPRATIATELDAIGYETAVCGKYMNLTDLLEDRSPPGWDNAAVSSGGYYAYDAYVNDAIEPHGNEPADYSTDVFADHCLGFLAAAPADAPIFAWLTPYATHQGADSTGVVTRWEPAPAPRHWDDERCAGIEPWRPPNYNSPTLTGKPAYIRGQRLLRGLFTNGFPLDRRCRALLSVDEWLGQTIALLEQQGRYENTLFVLTSDNGMGFGAFRGQSKGAPHIAQMPLLLAWPGVIGNVPRQLDYLLSNVDLAPTLCELAGCEMGPYPNGQPADGQSFAGLIAPSRSTSVPERRAIVLEQAGFAGVPAWRAVMTDPVSHSTGRQWFHIRYVTGEMELYDITGGPCHAWVAGMSADPCMLTNLAKAKPNLRRKLNVLLKALW